MTETPPPPATDAALRQRLIVLAAAITALALLHHVDHVIRGDLVLSYALPAFWNHSGWPFQPPVTPFTASLAIYLLLVPGISFTLRGRLWAGYWLGTAIVLGAIIVVVHFLPGPRTETPRVIYSTYARSVESTGAGVLALVDVFAIVVLVVLLALLAIRVRRLSGRW